MSNAVDPEKCAQHVHELLHLIGEYFVAHDIDLREGFVIITSLPECAMDMARRVMAEKARSN